MFINNVNLKWEWDVFNKGMNLVNIVVDFSVVNSRFKDVGVLCYYNDYLVIWFNRRKVSNIFIYYIDCFYCKFL